MIEKLGKMLRQKEITCVELTEKFIDASKSHNTELNSYISLTEDTAINAATAVDAKLQAGEELSAFSGIPLALSDNIVTRGLRTTGASQMLINHRPIYDASVCEYLKAEGAVLIGKANLDEFGMGSTGETSCFGAIKNPRNTEHVAGTGAAAAVASGTAAFGLATDTGGAVRQSAAFCGIIGLKPTYGAVSRNGLIAFASSFDQIGPLAANVRDCAAVFDAICRPDRARDMTCCGAQPVSGKLTDNINGMKIGVLREFYDDLAPDVASAMDSALKELQKMGAQLVELDFPLLQASLSAYYIISSAEASSSLGRYTCLRFGQGAEKFSDLDDYICRSRAEGFGPEVQKRILFGTYVLSAEHYDAYYAKAQRLKNAVINEYRRVLAQCDCIVTPTVKKTAAKRGLGHSLETYKTDVCTASVNLAGLPAMSIPCGFGDGGLPVGMQIIGGKFREDVILSAALAFETHTGGEFISAPETEVV